jgi:dienelactone hydrolase
MTRRVLTVLAVAVALVLAGTAGLLLGPPAGRSVVTDGVPMQVRLPDGGDRVPAVVIAHGFAGSGRLMRGFADTLVASGYATVLIDFTGHGSNSRRMPPEGVARDRALQADLQAAVDRIRREPRVDPSRVALVGHSMGARAATRFAAGDPSIAATVAISLGVWFGRSFI